jgi:DNA-binding IscR family transcriptional regulator
MNVSTKSEYVLRALIYLACASRREAIPACEIAEARAALVGVLDQTTIADLCTPANQKNLVSLKSSL